MMRKITFATFDPVFRDTPHRCTTCYAQPPVFRYELSYGVEEQEPEVGFCCKDCSDAILHRLVKEESQSWREEEATLKKEDVDVNELHEWREAAFQR